MNSQASDFPVGAPGKDSLKRHGRSFYWAGQLLSGPHFLKAASLYGVCRDIDDLADDAISTRQKSEAAEKLTRLDGALTGGCPPEGSTKAIYEQAISLFQDEPVALMALRDMVRTIEGDLRPVALASYRDLLQYAYGVAGTVGVMMASILGAQQRQKSLPHAIDLGIGMQLTNIARDVLEDAHLGRVYLPAEGAAGALTPENIIAGDPASRQQAWAGVQEILEMAEKYYESGWQGLEYLPLRPRLSIAVAARVYQQIGRQILDHGEDHYWHGRAVVNWRRKLWVSLKALMRLVSGRSLERWSGHESGLHQGLNTCLDQRLQ